MSEVLGNVYTYLQYPFVLYAIIVGTLIALCTSLLGVTLVLRRFSYVSDGLSHVAFGAMAIAFVLKITNYMLFSLPLTIICAIFLLNLGQNTGVKGDAAIAMLSVSAMAVGYLLMNVFSTAPNISGDVCTTLFGSTSILTLTSSDVWLSIVLAILVVVFFLLFYHKLFALTFDEDFAKATGTNVERYNLMLAIIVAVIIVLAMSLVGALLISALVIFPALSAMRLFDSFKGVTICSVVLSVVCAFLGMLISVVGGTPVGATIVLMDMLAYMLSVLFGRWRE